MCEQLNTPEPVEVETPAVQAAPIVSDDPFADKTKHVFPWESLLHAAKDFIEYAANKRDDVTHWTFNGEETAYFRCLREAVEREEAALAAEPDAVATILDEEVDI